MLAAVQAPAEEFARGKVMPIVIGAVLSAGTLAGLAWLVRDTIRDDGR